MRQVSSPKSLRSNSIHKVQGNNTLLEQSSNQNLQFEVTLFYFNFNQKVVNNYAYCFDEVLGQGQFSTAFKGRNILTNQQVAVKVIDQSRIKDNISLVLIQNEIEILKMLNHQNLLKLYDVFNTVNNIYIITELCNQGDLETYIKNSSRIDIPQAIKILKHLLLGLLQLQNTQIIHRDIKPANILISNGIPKLADFGFSIQKDLTQQAQFQQLRNFNVGTPLYMSPESLLQNIYSYKSDIWALGIVFYEMIFGQVPFFYLKERELSQKIYEYQQTFRLNFPKEVYISNLIKSILKGMLHPNPKERWSIQEIFLAFDSDSVPDDSENQLQTPYVKMTRMQKSQNQAKQQTKSYSARDKFVSSKKVSFSKDNDQKNNLLLFLLAIKQILQQDQEKTNVELIHYIIEMAIKQSHSNQQKKLEQELKKYPTSSEREDDFYDNFIDLLNQQITDLKYYQLVNQDQKVFNSLIVQIILESTQSLSPFQSHETQINRFLVQDFHIRKFLSAVKIYQQEFLQ